MKRKIELLASTQLNTHNRGQINFLNKLNATRVNLARELNLNEIKELALTGHKNSMATEVFVHGSYCISFSGICYVSSVLGGNSGNRGRCSQPCRDSYLPFLNKTRLKKPPVLSVLISSQKDVDLCCKTCADIFFQLPNCLKNKSLNLRISNCTIVSIILFY